MTDLPDVASATYEQPDRALAAVARAHRLAAHEVTSGLPDSVPSDVAAWWLEAWTKRLEKPPPLPPKKGAP